MRLTSWDEAVSLQVEVIDRTSDFIQKMMKWNRMLLSPLPVETGLTPHKTVYRKHKTKLLRYAPSGEKVHSTPIVIAFALVNKPYVLDLIPRRSVIEFLVSRGFDVYLVDWGVPSDCDSDKGLDLYVNYYLDRMVDCARKISKSKKVTLMGYCMGGTMSLMYTALHQEKIKNLVLMATPFDFSSNDGVLYQWSKDFPVDELTGIYGNCPGWYLNLSFAALHPTGMMDKAVNFYKNMMDDEFLRLFLAMEKWSADAQPVPGRAYGEFIKYGFQQNLLMKNQFPLGDKVVDLGRITCPLLNLIADRDNLVPPSSSQEIADYVSCTDTETIRCETGHIGLSVSGKSLGTLWPQASLWLEKRSGKMKSINYKEN